MKFKTGILLIITGLSGCQLEPDYAHVDSTSLTETNQQRLLETKKAILSLDSNKVRTLLTEIDVNAALPDDSRLLAWAIETQTPALVDLLLENGAKVNIAGGNRFSPLIQACRYGNSTVINALLQKDANVQNAIEDGTSAFHLCAASASGDTLARMIKAGAEINATNTYGQTPLMFAANAGNVNNLTLLLDAGADINQQTQEGYSALFFAIKSLHLDAVKAAIARGADVLHRAQDGTTASQLAVYTSNFEFLTWFAKTMPSLLAKEAINAQLTAYDRDGYQLLHQAVKANKPELVGALLALGANPSALSEPSRLKWRYEANFKTQSYLPPQLTPFEIAEKNKLEHIAALLRNSRGVI
ncbi:MAG: hypothetical protein CL589_02675 [Alteromonadaceae bacterium]|nr:hypothetical protein [Alteromonadaceae bacterium]MAX41536.1 hypothetical protein [Alteromonadaceae bacterium]|tara:strand:+ start:1955 stop:3025 length:1071 start_codon:yes stop_codon:yes gene_type:complete